MGKPTVFTDVKVTGALEAGTVKVAGIEDVDAAVDAASTPTKAEFNALVAVVNGIRAVLGADDSAS